MTGFLSHLFSRIMGTPGADPILDAAVERAVDSVARRLKQFRGYPRRYLPAVQHILARVRQMSADVPGPVTLDADHYLRDPFVHTLFGAPNDIRQLCSAPVMHTFASQHGTGEVYALLSMRPSEKHTFGLALDGEIMHRDVAKRVVHFADHQLIGPARTENEARERLLWYLFDHYMEHVAQGLGRLRDERDRLYQEKDLALVRLRGAGMTQNSVRQHELESVLADLGEASAALDPDSLSEVFDIVLSHPEDCLMLFSRRLNLDTMGEIQGDAVQPGVFALDFVDLQERDRETRTLVLVRLPEVSPISSTERLDEAARLLR
jgi:hypothetical protein